MRRQRVRAEGIRRDLPTARIEAARLQDVVNERRDQPLVRRLHGRDEIGGKLRHRHQLRTDLLRQRLHELHDLLLEQPRNQPVAAPRRNLVQLRKRHGDRHAVLRRSRLEVVREFELDAAELELVRERLGRHAGRLVAHQVFALEVQQFWRFPLGLLAPLVEVGAVGDAFRDDPVVEGDDQFVVDQNVRPARLVFQRFDVEHELVVVLVERPTLGVFLGNLAGDQSLADEQLARLGRIHRAVVHTLLRIDDDSVERRTLEGHGLHRLLFPVRIEVAALDQVSAHFLQPLGFDARDATGEELGRLGDLGRGDPLAGFLVERRSGVDQELDAARAEVVARILGLAADVAKQAGEQRTVDGVVIGRKLVFLPTVLRRQRVQLIVNVVPLAHAQRREEILMAGLHQLAVRFLVLQLAFVPLPELEPGEKFGLFVGEFLVRGVSRALLFLRPFARVLRRQRGGDDQHFLEAALVARGDDHARDARVERQLGEFLPDRGERPLFRNGAQFL